MKEYEVGNLKSQFVETFNDNAGLVRFKINPDKIFDFINEFTKTVRYEFASMDFVLMPYEPENAFVEIEIQSGLIKTCFEHCYLIDKGIRDCALEVADKRLFPGLKNLITDSFREFSIFESSEKLNDENVISFYIYKESFVQILINQVELQSDLVIRQALLGKLLGYSAKSCHDYLINESENFWIQKIPKEFRSDFDNLPYPKYFQFIGNLHVDPAKDFIVIVDPDKRIKD